MTRVLVVGAGGFVGANLMRDLMRRPGVDAQGWCRPGGNRWRIERLKGAKIADVDIVKENAISALRALRPEVVINAAAEAVTSSNANSPTLHEVNAVAPLRLLRAANEAGAKRFVHLGSYFEYGDRSDTLREDDKTRPKTPYAASKAKATQEIASSSLSTEAVVFRLFNLWGPWESARRLIPQVINACRTEQPLALTSGTQLKDFCSVRDVAGWVADLALRDAPLPCRIVNVASGTMTAVRELVTRVAHELGGEQYMQFGAKHLPEGEPQTGPADLARLTTLLPNRSVTALADVLAETLAEGVAP